MWSSSSAQSNSLAVSSLVDGAVPRDKKSPCIAVVEGMTAQRARTDCYYILRGKSLCT